MTDTRTAQRRGELVTQMRTILDTANAFGRDLNADEQAKYDRLEIELDSITNKASPERDKARAELSRIRNSEYARDFFNFLRTGDEVYTNALQVGTDSEGGYIVPQEFEREVVKILTNGNPIRQAAKVVTLSSDRNVPVETDAGAFGWIAEEGAYTEDDPVFANIVLGAHKVGGIVKVSEELELDAQAFVNYITDLAARRFINAEDTAFGNGDGSGKPTGLFQTATVGGVTVTGFTGAVAATAAITGNDIIETFHALKRSYRRNASWVTSDEIVKMLRKVKDGDGRYIWQPGLQAGQPDRVLGRPVIVTDGTPTVAPEAKSIVFADLSQYYIADRVGMTVQRLNELYSENGQVGFKFMKRTDAKMVDPKAITYFKHGAAA